jgi:glycosyltransferase involved in cell wall biosynthesis
VALLGRIPSAARLASDEVIDIVAARGEPQLTVLMPLFRQEAFVAEAVQSVLEQQGVVCEVILSDDASSDRTLDEALEVVRRHRGRHPHAVRVRRGTRRLRRAHILALSSHARTPVLVQAHGDDVSLPHRMRELHSALEGDAAIFAASPFTTIDETGATVEEAAPVGVGTSVLDLEQALARPAWLIGAVQAWRPDRLDVFTPLTLDFAPLGHDRILPIRAALLGGARVVGEALVKRRVHSGNWSKRVVDGGDWRTKKHGWNLARVMIVDVALSDVARAEAAGAIAPAAAASARTALVELRERHGAQLRAQHADLVARGRRLVWVDDEADG